MEKDNQLYIVEDRLKGLMRKKQINASHLAYQTGISEASLSQYLNHKHIPNDETAKILGYFFNVNPAWIQGEKTAKKGDESIGKEIVPKLKRLKIQQREIILEIINTMICANDAAG